MSDTAHEEAMMKALEYWKETLIENSRLKRCLRDCVDVLRGELWGTAPFYKVLGEAERLLSADRQDKKMGYAPLSEKQRRHLSRFKRQSKKQSAVITKEPSE